jgi:ketosteroid isomerase-like protein
VTDITDIVRDYYPRIDRMDVEGILQLFAPTAVYDRAGALYVGLPSIATFYREARRIRGTHSIEHLVEDEARRAVMVMGRFEGKGADGSSKAIDFADLWQFDESKSVCLRRTYLALGHTYVAS